MAALHAAAAGALEGGALAANGGMSSSRPQVVCSAKPSGGAGFLPKQPGSLSVSATPLRSVTLVGDNGRISATELKAAPETEEEEQVVEEPVVAEKSPDEISAFMADVANLVKLVNSRDVTELELKYKDYEVIIRKEAQQPAPPPTTFPGPHVMAHTSYPGWQQPPPPPPPAPAAAPAPAPAAVAAPPPAPVAPAHPPMLSPMAGTFYRSPGPGEPVFVKVGDKVIKGQVVCIVEAMKLMNEIEADQSGTIEEILAVDGKPISMETALFLIKP